MRLNNPAMTRNSEEYAEDVEGPGSNNPGVAGGVKLDMGEKAFSGTQNPWFRNEVNILERFN